MLLQKPVLVFTSVCEADEAEMRSVWDISGCPDAFQNSSMQGIEMEIVEAEELRCTGWVTWPLEANTTTYVPFAFFLKCIRALRFRGPLCLI